MKYFALFLAAFAIILMTEGCILNPVKIIKEIIVGKPKKVSKEFTNEDNLTEEELRARRKWCAKHALPTVKQKARKLFGLGASIGGAMILIAILGHILAKMALDKAIKLALAGVVTVIVSILFDEYLVWILSIGALLGVAVMVYYLYRHREKLKKMVDFTDEIKKKGQLTEEQIHAAARKTIGETGSTDRLAVKAIVNSTRTKEA